LIWVWAMIIICLAAKALVAERRLFNRFTVDFDTELSTIPEIVEP